MTEELPKFLSTGQVMNLTGLSRYDVDCLVKSGRLRCIVPAKMNRKFYSDEVQSLVKQIEEGRNAA
jgi:hypothetical protein